MNDPDTGKQRRPWIPLLLFLLPAWLIVSAGIGIWIYFRNEETKANQLHYAFGKMVSAESLIDDVRKITGVIGERHGGSEKAREGLTRITRMIEGSLGPSNTGLTIQRVNSPTEWPILTATIPGKKPTEKPIWLVASYDSRPGSVGTEANATGVAAVLSAAQALVNTPLTRSVHVALLPHLNDPESPVLDTAKRFLQAVGDAHLILCIEAMGGGETLWLSSRDTQLPFPDLSGNLGDIKGAEVICLNDDTDLASVLFELGAPAIRVATRAQVFVDDPDNAMPDPETLAAATGRLVTLIKRCAGVAIQ